MVDTRESHEFEDGHLPNAMHLSKGVIERDIEVEIPATGKEIVLYCGGRFRSALAADNLKKMGYTNVNRWQAVGATGMRKGLRQRGKRLLTGERHDMSVQQKNQDLSLS